MIPVAMTTERAYVESMSSPALMTADQLLSARIPNKRVELVRGLLVVREPDIAFISRERLPDPVPAGFLDLAPDLAVEVLSPDDRPGAVLQKVADWLSAGVRLVWVVDPVRRLARVYRHDGTQAVAPADGMLDGEDVLPGFSCALCAVL